MMKLLLSPSKYIFSSPLISSHKYWLSLSASSSLWYEYGLSSSSSNKRRFSSSLSSSSSSPDKYEHFFPSFYNEYITHRINFYYSLDTPHLPRSSEVDRVLKDVFDKDRMDFPDLVKEVHYEYDFDVKKRFLTWKREDFDVISLLPSHGDELIRIGGNNNNGNNVVKAESLRGKHVLICCASIPLLWIDKHAAIWRKLSMLYKEMSRSDIGRDFEMVIVAKMKREWDDDEGVFDHFSTAFSGCLVVPFSHKYWRDYICHYLRFEGKPMFVLVDPSQKVISHNDSCGDGDIVKYGARGFPFTCEHIISLSKEDGWGTFIHDPIPSCNRTLAGLLKCESNPFFVLHKFDSEEETTCIGRLNKKLVGLYLFRQGDKLKDIHMIYQQCQKEGLDFEIILVCLSSDYSIHPRDFQEVVRNVLKKFRVPNWWVLPYNHSVYLRLSN